MGWDDCTYSEVGIAAEKGNGEFFDGACFLGVEEPGSRMGGGLDTGWLFG